MKKLILTCAIISILLSCKEKEQPISKATFTTIEGRYTLVNSDQPIPNVYVYLYTGVFPNPSEVLDWCYTDSNGNYTLTFENHHRNAKFNDNLDGLPYIFSRQKGGIFNELTFLPDGLVHRRDFELVPPAWVNVRMIDKGKFSGYHEINVSSENYQGGGWNIYGPKDSTILVKVHGNMQDTISFSYRFRDGSLNPPFYVLKSLKFPIFVPPFQVQEMTIEY
jgi:hypothetical protein